MSGLRGLLGLLKPVPIISTKGVGIRATCPNPDAVIGHEGMRALVAEGSVKGPRQKRCPVCGSSLSGVVVEGDVLP